MLPTSRTAKRGRGQVRSIVVRRPSLGRLLLVFALLSAAPVFGCSSELPAGAIAEVGTAIVSQDTFDSLVAAYVAAGKAPDKDEAPEDYRKFEQAIAEYLVVLEILRQEASDYDVSVTEKEVKEKLAQAKQMFQGDEERFLAALEQQNLTLEQFTQSLRDTLWLDKMKAAVTQSVSVTEDEAQAYYQKHKAEYVKQEAREVRHILISPFAKLIDGSISTKTSQTEWDAARTEAEKIRSEILNGADFVTQAEKYSDDAGTAESGGKLGAIVRGQMVPDFEEAVFSLRKGELSEPIKTQYGYHLIEVTDITPEEQLSYDQVKENIRTALLAEKQKNTWEAWLRAKEIELGVVYHEKYAPPARNDSELDSLPSTSTSKSTTTTKPASGGSQ